jgi:dipeptidyl aminopeptidase/acylaminoacyl peptidase
VPEDLEARAVSRAEFEQYKAYAGGECFRIAYRSDGLKVTGYLWKPKHTGGRKLPLIIFNRGGLGESGKLTAWRSFGFYRFVSEGYVVLGSQYRGNDGGEGEEEFGGADVNDVLNLVPLARSLGYVDVENVFLLGLSRGGMMAYLSLKKGIRVNAVAVIGGLADLQAAAKHRPLAVETIYRPAIPDFDRNPDEKLRERSAVFWPERIRAPALLLHGRDDWRADAGSQTLAFARKLHEAGNVYELVVYAGDDHGLTLHHRERDRRILDWFKKHRR